MSGQRSWPCASGTNRGCCRPGKAERPVGPDRPDDGRRREKGAADLRGDSHRRQASRRPRVPVESPSHPPSPSSHPAGAGAARPSACRSPASIRPASRRGGRLPSGPIHFFQVLRPTGKVGEMATLRRLPPEPLRGDGEDPPPTWAFCSNTRSAQQAAGSALPRWLWRRGETSAVMDGSG